MSLKERLRKLVAPTELELKEKRRKDLEKGKFLLEKEKLRAGIREWKGKARDGSPGFVERLHNASTITMGDGPKRRGRRDREPPGLFG
jgi:hypothetical protein